jgi:hypothetical protein
VQVTAYRNDDHENAIPSLVAHLLGIDTLGVSATAIAEAKDATATNCLRPIAIPDRWQEIDAPPWSEASTFDQSNPDPSLRDSYARPEPVTAGYGFRLSDPCLAEGVIPSCGYGAMVTLHAGALANPIPAWSYLPVDIPGSVNSVLQNMQGCAGVQTVLRPKVGPATRLTVELGAVASVADGANYLVNVADPGASWNPDTKRVEGSCAQSAAPCAPISPRIIAIALYNPNTLYGEIAAGPATAVVVTNAIGFFIKRVVGATDLEGYITTYPGQVSPDGVALIEDASFLRTSILVQ